MKEVAISIHADADFNPSIIDGLEGYDYIHLDVMDGVFVEPKKLNLDAFKRLKEKVTVPIIAHLMVQTPFDLIDNIINDIDVFLFHYESEGDKSKIIDKVKSLGKKVGIVINPETEISLIKDFLEKVDMILVMSVHPGWSGQKFIPETIEKINTLAKYKDKFDFRIDVDGGVNLANAKQLINADILSSSSTILKAKSPNQVIHELKAADESD